MKKIEIKRLKMILPMKISTFGLELFSSLPASLFLAVSFAAVAAR